MAEEERNTVAAHAEGHEPSAQQEMLSALLNAISHTADGVFAVDAGQRIILWNEAATGLLGFRSEEVLGKRCYEVFSSRVRNGNHSCGPGCPLFSTARKGRLIESHDMVMPTKAARPIWVNASVIVVPPQLAGLFAMIYVFRDITSHVQAETVVEKIRAALSGVPPSIKGSDSLPPGRNPLHTLRPRQLEVLRLIAQGASTKAIAETLSLSPATVRNHTQKILVKLGVHTKLQAVALAFKHDLQ